MSGAEIQPTMVDEALRRRFETAWVRGEPAPIEQCLPAEDDAGYLPTLEELVHIDLEFQWETWSRARDAAKTPASERPPARPPRVEDYLARFPRLKAAEVLPRLLRQEWRVRKECGDKLAIDEYRRRFDELGIPECDVEASIEASIEAPELAAPELAAPGLAATLPPPLSLTNAGPPGDDATAAEYPRPFGNYDLLEEIGRGGMGVVYRARQHGADRVVALKVIRRELLALLSRDTQTSALDRFHHEVRAAARLEHDNIVSVYEVGDVAGEPFFSMQYVDGASLGEMLRTGPVENRRAAAYLHQVARAVAAAHRHGILHRDLKPQNILVDSRTDRPLVADFGLAKLSEGGDELTRAGEIMGTPSYMSPEQAKDSARVTAQTDVYALGATLYHILAARPPFQAATPLETLRQVIDEEPLPSRQLNPSIDRDLETICSKCLQKEPSRRYGSAELLARDLGRYLGGEPILARPIGQLHRLWRWCRRNPVVAALTAAMIVTLLAGTAISSYFAMEKEAQARKAMAEKRRADQKAADSEESLRHARKTVQNFYTRVAEDTLLDQPGMQPLRRELLQEALDSYQDFLARRGDDPGVRDELAAAHFHVGCIAEEIDSPGKALASYRRARRMQKELLAERPADRLRLVALGNTLNAIGKVLRRMQKPDDALKAYREALKYRTQLAEADPKRNEFQRTLVNSYMNVGIIERERGNLDQARRQLERAQTVRTKLLSQGEEDPKIRRDLGMGYYNLANLAIAAGDDAGARKNLQQAIVVFEKLLNDNPKNLVNQRHLALCCRLLADLKHHAGHTDSALDLYKKALGQMKTLAGENPNVPDYRADLARLHMNLGGLEYEQISPQAALQSFRQALDILRKLAEGYPKVPEYRRELAVTLREIGLLESDAGQYQSAHGDLETAGKRLRELVELFPDNNDFKIEQITTTAALRMNLGQMPRGQRPFRPPLESFRQAADIFKTLTEKYPRVPRCRRDFAVTLRIVAQLQAEAGQEQTARENLETAVGHLRALVARFPGTGDFQSQLAKTQAALDGLDVRQP